jgi:hypothetical protein
MRYSLDKLEDVMTKRLPVTHRAFINSSGERYVLGYATTALGATRLLRKRDSRVKDAVQVRLKNADALRVWEPR